MLSPQYVPRTLHTTRMLDAVDHIDRPLGALRAIEALTECYKADSEVDLPNLRRPDLANLLCLVANDLAQLQAQARQAADDELAQTFPQPTPQPVKASKGAKA